MTNAAVRLEGDQLGDDVKVWELHGTEEISQLFAFELLISANDATFKPADVMGSNVCIVFERDGEDVRRIYGMVSALRDKMDTVGEKRRFMVTVSPHAYALSLVRTQETVLDLDPSEVIQRKFDLADMSDQFAARVSNKYPKADLVTQFDETDLAFITRISERAGISFVFDHEDDRDTFVLVDDNAGFPTLDCKEILVVTRHDEVGVVELAAEHRLAPDVFMVQDYNYETPQTEMFASAPVNRGWAGGEVEYGGNFKTVDEGRALAQRRAEQRASERLTYVGRSTDNRLAAGTTVKLVNHPTLGDIEVLVVSTEHILKGSKSAADQGKDGEPGSQTKFETLFRAIPKEIPYRPPLRTPQPRISGVVNGVVVAVGALPPHLEQEGQGSGDLPENQACIDAEGRYLVHLYFDNADPQRPRASIPLRMAQPHAGTRYGMHFPLKPGVEVLVAFVNGDPDRPVIMGAVPNTVVPTVVAGSEATINRLQSQSGVRIEMGD